MLDSEEIQVSVVWKYSPDLVVFSFYALRHCRCYVRYVCCIVCVNYTKTFVCWQKVFLFIRVLLHQFFVSSFCIFTFMRTILRCERYDEWQKTETETSMIWPTDRQFLRLRVGWYSSTYSNKTFQRREQLTMMSFCLHLDDNKRFKHIYIQSQVTTRTTSHTKTLAVMWAAQWPNDNKCTPHC